MSTDPTSQVVPDRKSRPAATVILTRESGLVDCGFDCDCGLNVAVCDSLFDVCSGGVFCYCYLTNQINERKQP